MALVTITQPVSWNFDECTLRTFRVQGACKPAGSSSADNGGGCADPALPCNSSQQQQFVVNITACTVEEVCKKLRDRNFVKTIDSIQVFSAPVFGEFTGGDPNCLTDVTPSIENCVDCCDFLIDDDRKQNVKVIVLAMAHFSCQATGTIVLGNQNNYNPGFTASGSGVINVSGNFSISSSHYSYSMNGTINTGGASNAMTSYYHYDASGSVDLSSNTGYGSSKFETQAAGVININSGTTYGLRFTRQASGKVNIRSGTQAGYDEAHFLSPATGKITIGSNTSVINHHFNHAMSGTIDLSGGTQVLTTAYSYQMGGLISVDGRTKLGFRNRASGRISLSGNSSYRPNIVYPARGVINLENDFDIASSNYYHSVSGMIQTSGNTQSRSSNLGTINFDAKVTVESEDIGVEFSETAAPRVAPLAATVILPSCCTVPIPVSLEIKHNLDQLLALNRFLLRNGFGLPGTNGTIVPLQYRPRLGAWQNNLHYHGESAEYAGGETWDIVFELLCSDQSAGSFLPSDLWQFMMFIRKKEEAGPNFVARLIAIFDVTTFCPSGKRFDGFDFNFNMKTRTALPAMNRLGIFHDEAGLFSASPSFNTKPELSFRIATAGANREVTTDWSLEEPRNATVHVADSSGHPF